MTMPLEDNLHYVTGGREGTSQSCPVYQADVARGGIEGIGGMGRVGWGCLPMKAPMTRTQDRDPTRSTPRRAVVHSHVPNSQKLPR